MQSPNALASGPLGEEAFCELISPKSWLEEGEIEISLIKMLKFSFVLSVSGRNLP